MLFYILLIVSLILAFPVLKVLNKILPFFTSPKEKARRARNTSIVDMYFGEVMKYAGIIFFIMIFLTEICGVPWPSEFSAKEVSY